MFVISGLCLLYKCLPFLKSFFIFQTLSIKICVLSYRQKEINYGNKENFKRRPDKKFLFNIRHFAFMHIRFICGKRSDGRAFFVNRQYERICKFLRDVSACFADTDTGCPGGFAGCAGYDRLYSGCGAVWVDGRIFDKLYRHKRRQHNSVLFGKALRYEFSSQTDTYGKIRIDDRKNQQEQKLFDSPVFVNTSASRPGRFSLLFFRSDKNVNEEIFTDNTSQ